MNKKIIILGIPYDFGSKIPGGRFAPAGIIDHIKIHDPWLITKENNINKILLMNIPDNNQNILKKLTKEYHKFKKYFLITLGGDHSILYPIISSLNNKKINLIYLDSHSDLHNERGIKNWSVINKINKLTNVNIFNIGNRCDNKLFHKNKISNITTNEVLDKTCLNNFLSKIPQNPTYTSIDLDVLDPAFAPAVSSREGGGLSPRELVNIINKIISNFKIIGIDLVEYNPQRENDDITLDSIRYILKNIINSINNT